MIVKSNGKDITELVGNMTLDSNIDTLGDQLSFSVAYGVYLKANINVGDLMQIYDNKEVFRGITVTKGLNEKSHDFTCFDFAFYLNKSKAIKQFNNVRADTAIKQLLSEFNVPIGSIASMPVMIRKIYFDKEVSAIIKDILQEVTNATGVKYVMEMNFGKLDIYKDTDKMIKAYAKISENYIVDCMRTISSPTRTESIEEMKNSIKLYVGNEDKVKVYAEAKNDALIKKYGLLQETQSLDEKDIAQAKNIAQNLLKELGKVSITAGITVAGSFDLRAGRIVEVNEPITGIIGRYKIKSVSHSIGNTHTTTLELEA